MIDFEDFLSHHGIKGQKWGIRNAEWYPIDAYLKSKGLDKPIAKATSAGSDVVKTASSKAKTAGEILKDTVSKVKESYDEHKKKQKKRNAVKKAKATKERNKIQQRKEEEKQEAFEEKKQRILNSGTPGEVLSIADQLTNQELKYALERNNSLNDLRKAESTRVKQINEKKVRKKWGKYIDMAESLEMSTKPIADVTKVVERFHKLNKALSGKTDDNKSNKKKKQNKNNDKDDDD